MMNHAENLERALRASLTYEAARAESIRYACFDDTPERLVGQPHAWIETVLQVAEEEAGGLGQWPCPESVKGYQQRVKTMACLELVLP